MPFAPISLQCDFSKIETDKFSIHETSLVDVEQAKPIINFQNVTESVPSSELSTINNLIDDILQPKKIEKSSASVTPQSILAQLNATFETVEPFSLSIWRPLDGVIIIDSRNTKLALPTELLLKNIAQHIFPARTLQLQEEVLRWPMIENSFAKRSIEDARNELQTWLSVQHEIRPIKYIWLMGKNSATYLLPPNVVFSESLFNSTELTAAKINALILPSLNEILQKPAVKQKLFSAIRRYHI
ncbi:MAG: hypothetical protein EOO68_11485 [Moraxellaceae bacterium]|nr:MAG: hypothetical protein EOO68_11485 [Moraxellaceae bacterium]